MEHIQPKILKANRKLLLIIVSATSFVLVLVSIVQKNRQENVSLTTNTSFIVARQLIPLLNFVAGEQNAINRIFQAENKMSQKTDDIYSSAEKRVLSDLNKKIEKSIGIEVSRRVKRSIEKKLIESVERNLAAALDDKETEAEIIDRIKILDQRIQVFESQVLLKVIPSSSNVISFLTLKFSWLAFKFFERRPG